MIHTKKNNYSNTWQNALHLAKRSEAVFLLQIICVFLRIIEIKSAASNERWTQIQFKTINEHCFDARLTSSLLLEGRFDMHFAVFTERRLYFFTFAFHLKMHDKMGQLQLVSGDFSALVQDNT